MEVSDEASRAKLMSFLRDMLSAMNMATHSPATMPRVEKETARLLWLAVNPNSRAKSGSNG